MSKGKRGEIKKVVRYDLIQPGLYNFGFGDQKPDFTIDDKVNSDNGDIRKVMATVIQTIPFFFKIHPNQALFFKGSNLKRTNFYNWIIERNKEEWEQDYFIIGEFRDGTREKYRTKQDYILFIVTKN